ncbi:restriction endonuclease subunit S [Hominenteromicrobium sp.]|uniref:restriction endonuclease subunit S n=1 Tax=Hominenteromicrobium sp. TaxID=3073581 RepID=UPI003AB8CA96
MSVITAKASRKMKKYAVLTREPRCFLGSFDFSWEQRKLSEMCGTFEYGLNAAAKEFDGKNKYIRITDIDDASREFLLSDLSSPDICLDGMSKYLLSSGDIVFARTGASVGKTYIYRENDGIVYFAGFLIRAKVNQDNDAEFVFQSTLSPSYEKYIRITSQRSGQPGVNAQEYSEYDLFAPSKEEQQRIGHFLRGIDNLITLHQRKCALLFSPFQALISMMFTTSTFSWEQRKLGEIGSVSMCRRIFKEQTSETGDIPFYKIGTFGADPDAFISRELFEEYKSKYPYPQKGDILISASGSIGRAVEFAGNNEYFQDSNIVWLNHDERLSNPFLKCFYSVVKWAGIEGSTIKRLYNDNILNTVICMPSVPEQKRIGLFFENLDNLITLHQRKCISFTGRAGRLISTVNKKRITSSWEQRKFSDITFPAGEKNKDNLPLESYSITNEHGFVPQDEKFENGGTMREADKRMYYIVSPNSFAYNPARINVGSIGYQNIGKNVIVSSLYEVFKTSEDVDDRLLWHWFKSPDFQKLIMQLQEGGVRLYFYYDKLCMGEVSLPLLEEQRKIGKLFDTLDNLITLHQRKPFLMKWRTSDANRNQTNRLVL